MRRSLDDLISRLFLLLARRQDAVDGRDPHISSLPKVAANHLAASMWVADRANDAGLHAVALGLSRHSFEALTIVDLGLVRAPRAEQELRRWAEGATSAGAVRKWLEANAWNDRNPGLWDEPWSEFMAALGKALQPFAHFSPELLQWNFATVSSKSSGEPAVVGIGPGFVDEDKALRLEVLRGVLTWILGQLAFGSVESPDPGTAAELDALRHELTRSEWLIGRDDWATNLIPHMWSATASEHA